MIVRCVCGGLFATERDEGIAATPSALCNCGNPRQADSVGRGNENQGADQVSEKPRAVQGEWRVVECVNGSGDNFAQIWRGESLVSQIDSIPAAHGITLAHNASLKDSSKDSARLDWLESEAGRTDRFCRAENTASRHLRIDVPYPDHSCKKSLRATIDAAMSTPQASEVVEEPEQTLGGKDA